MLLKIDLRQDAVAEVNRLRASRALGSVEAPSSIAGTLVAVARGGELRRRVGRRALLLWRVSLEDETGRSREAALVAMAIDLHPGTVDLRRSDWATARVTAEVTRAAIGWREEVERTIRSFVSTRMAREHGIARNGPLAGQEFQ